MRENLRLFVFSLFMFVGATWQGVAYMQAPSAPPVAVNVPVVMQDPAKPKAPPELTEVQRLRVQNLVQQMELAQYRIRQMAQEFELAKSTLQSLVLTMQVDGYVLDLSTLTYTIKTDKPR